jgi:hypothetical protein
MFRAVAVGNFSTRRRVSRICFQSVTNDPRRRRRGLLHCSSELIAIVNKLPEWSNKVSFWLSFLVLYIA